MIIYKITNKINGKIYVGQTVKSLEERWHQHVQYNSNCVLLKKAIEKYGKENFEKTILEECVCAETLDEREEFHIKELNSLAPNGYNLMTGGAAPKHSFLTKEKMSKTRKGKEPIWATKASHNEESNRKRFETLNAQNHFEWSEEKRNKARLSALYRAKQVMDQDGVIYESVADAARKTQCHRACIQKVLRNEAKKTKNKNGKTYTFTATTY